MSNPDGGDWPAPDPDPLYVPEDEPALRTRDRVKRKVLDNRRSVFLIDRLSREPARRRQQKRGARHG